MLLARTSVLTATLTGDRSVHLVAVVTANNSSDQTIAAGILLTTAGDQRGDVLVAPRGDGNSGSVLTIALDGVGPGAYHCSVVGGDGRRVQVASWHVTAPRPYLWKVSVGDEVAAGRAVVITDGAGAIVAAASCADARPRPVGPPCTTSATPQGKGSANCLKATGGMGR